jgi:hypothetical protein
MKLLIIFALTPIFAPILVCLPGWAGLIFLGLIAFCVERVTDNSVILVHPGGHVIQFKDKHEAAFAIAHLVGQGYKVQVK